MLIFVGFFFFLMLQCLGKCSILLDFVHVQEFLLNGNFWRRLEIQQYNNENNWGFFDFCKKRREKTPSVVLDIKMWQWLKYMQCHREMEFADLREALTGTFASLDVRFELLKQPLFSKLSICWEDYMKE